MKLVIASTPKSGNTWLRYLLNEVYRLPMVDLPRPSLFSAEEMAKLPARWVGQQHYYPNRHLFDWAVGERAVFLTTVRHPGDILLSLCHFVRTCADDPRWDRDPAGCLRQDIGGPGEHATAYVLGRSFTEYLELSLAWMADGRSIIVRYEDLCGDPDATMTRVVRAIHDRRPDAGLPLERVPGAVAACEIGMLREGLGLAQSFFRKGGSGGWVDELPPAVLEAFRTLAPYPDLFARLGYSPEPALARPAAPRAGSVVNPFEKAQVDRSEDGTRFSPFLVRLFLSLDDPTRARLHPLAGFSDPSSFLVWLCAPAVEDPFAGSGPRVTNLAPALYAQRVDIQHLFPDPFGRDRVAFMEWFVDNAGRDHGLDPGFFPHPGGPQVD
jgi:hypothetical protein